jgi:hypothetical protein
MHVGSDMQTDKRDLARMACRIFMTELFEHMYVCMHVCMYVRMHVYMHVSVYSMETISSTT